MKVGLGTAESIYSVIQRGDDGSFILPMGQKCGALLCSCLEHLESGLSVHARIVNPEP